MKEPNYEHLAIIYLKKHGSLVNTMDVVKFGWLLGKISTLKDLNEINENSIKELEFLMDDSDLLRGELKAYLNLRRYLDKENDLFTNELIDTMEIVDE